MAHVYQAVISDEKDRYRMPGLCQEWKTRVRVENHGDSLEGNMEIVLGRISVWLLPESMDYKWGRESEA